LKDVVFFSCLKPHLAYEVSAQEGAHVLYLFHHWHVSSCIVIQKVAHEVGLICQRA
jgi:hypothetical protein